MLPRLVVVPLLLFSCCCFCALSLCRRNIRLFLHLSSKKYLLQPNQQYLLHDLCIQPGFYDGPQVSRQNFLLTAKLQCLTTKLQFLTAKHSFHSKTLMSHGKTLIPHGKTSIPHGKTSIVSWQNFNPHRRQNFNASRQNFNSSRQNFNSSRQNIRIHTAV